VTILESLFQALFYIMDFSENLKLHLSYSDMAVKELAERSGIKKSTIDSYLTNRVRMPSAEAALRLARALGVTVEHLFGSFEENAGLKRQTGQRQNWELKSYREEKLLGEARDLVNQIRKFADRLEWLLTGGQR
jgi:transcriptional regulator with XRE-family HTH domain